MQEIVSEQDPPVDQDLLQRSGLHVPARRNDHRLPNDPQLPAQAQPVGKDQILQNRHLRKSSQRQETVPADEDAVGSHHLMQPGQEQMIQPPSVPLKERACRLVPLEETPPYSSLSKDASDPFDRIGRERHVGMREQQYLPRGGMGASVHLLGPATPRPEKQHAWIRPGHPIGPILRAAVHHHQLIRAEAGQVRKGSANKVALVENRKNDRDCRHRKNSQAPTTATLPYSTIRTH